MKKLIALFAVICFLFAGCGAAEAPMAEAQPQQTTVEETSATTEAPVETAPAAVGNTIYPLPENSMDTLNDGIFAVHLEDGDVYLDDTGILQMKVKIFGYDRYDMADVSMLEVGDVLVTYYAGEVQLTSLERPGDGSVSINGGLEMGGLDLIHDDLGVYYERGHDGMKNWHPIGEATLRVHEAFVYHDHGAEEQEETVYYAGSFLNGEVSDYDITPDNATIRVENGQVVEMHRFG